MDIYLSIYRTAELQLNSLSPLEHGSFMTRLAVSGGRLVSVRAPIVDPLLLLLLAQPCSVMEGGARYSTLRYLSVGWDDPKKTGYSYGSQSSFSQARLAVDNRSPDNLVITTFPNSIEELNRCHQRLSITLSQTVNLRLVNRFLLTWLT